LASPGAWIVDRCLERGLRINCTNNTILRFMPPMIVTKEQLDEAIDILDAVLSESA
jgi:4-aminobutyrate aminotransferase-like enzyme